jgi:hypothetical protein
MVGVVVKNKKIRSLTTAEGPARSNSSFGVGGHRHQSPLVLSALWSSTLLYSPLLSALMVLCSPQLSSLPSNTVTHHAGTR